MEAFKEKNYGIRVKRVEEKLFFFYFWDILCDLKIFVLYIAFIDD